MKKFLTKFSTDIGIDLGTCNTLIYTKERGVICQEPSVVAIEKGTNRIIAVGTDAKRMLWKTSDKISVVRPLRDGVIANMDAADTMLRYFIGRSFPRKWSLKRPRIVIGVPACITDVESAAVKESAHNCGAYDVELITESRAAAIGADIPIFEPAGNMVCDIGGGTTEVSVLSMGDMVIYNAIRLGGDEFDEAIVKYVRNTHNMIIGESTAELVKIEIGTASVENENKTKEIKGTDAVTGLPRRLEIDSVEIREALQGPVNAVIEEVKKALAKTPAELTADIVERGIVMTGGGSLLKGLDNLLSRETGVPAFVVDDPLTCVAIGAGNYHKFMNEAAILGNVYDTISNLK